MLARIFLPQKVRHIWFTFIPTFKFLITSRLHDVLAKKGVTQPPGSCDQYTVEGGFYSQKVIGGQPYLVHQEVMSLMNGARQSKKVGTPSSHPLAHCR